MTATYGRRLSDWWLSSSPVDVSLKMLLGTSIWGSTTCYLTWRKSVTPQGRLLFRLVPSTRRTGGIGSGYWGTPQERSYKDTPGANVPEAGYLARQVYNQTTEGGKLNSAWVSKMMGYPDGFLDLTSDGEEIR
jgi:hypothetical protein